jgi:rRNA maturation protein Rpf1
MRSLCHDLERVLPNTVHINRGKLSVSETIEKALEKEAERIIIVERWKGGPGRIRFYQTASEATTPLPLLILGGVKTQIDFGKRRRLSKNLVLAVTDNPSKETGALAQFLSTFLNVPFLKERTLEGQVQAVLRLSTIHAGGTRIQFMSLPTLKEVGPRLMIRRMVWEKLR